LEGNSWKRGHEGIFGRENGMEELEERMEENVREKCWDGRV
jgi:hypothetical protein